MAKTKAQLSKPAQKLLARVSEQNNYYKYTGEPGKYMMELMKAGFVVLGPREVELQTCFVPKGFRPAGEEHWPKPKEPKAKPTPSPPPEPAAPKHPMHFGVKK